MYVVKHFEWSVDQKCIVYSPSIYLYMPFREIHFKEYLVCLVEEGFGKVAKASASLITRL